MNATRSRRIVLAVGAAAALTGLAAGVHTGASAQAATDGAGTTKVTSKATSNTIPPYISTRVDGIRGDVSAWLMTMDDSGDPVLCAGPADADEPWCGNVGEEPFIAVQQTFDNVIVGVVPASTGEVDVAWAGNETGAVAKLGRPWRGMRVFAVDADDLGKPYGSGKGGLGVYTHDAKDHTVQYRSFLPASVMKQFAPVDAKAKIAPLYAAANNEALLNAVDGLAAWRIKDRTCVGRLGQMEPDGRFYPGEVASPEALLRWWPQYCSDALKGSVSDAWALGWNAPQISGSRHVLVAVPGKTKRASLDSGENLSLVTSGPNKLTLVDVSVYDTELNLGTQAKPRSAGPVGKIAEAPMFGLGVLRIAD